MECPARATISSVFSVSEAQVAEFTINFQAQQTHSATSSYGVGDRRDHTVLYGPYLGQTGRRGSHINHTHMADTYWRRRTHRGA